MEKQKRAQHVSKNLQIIFQKNITMIRQNISHLQEERRSSETIQTIMAVK